MNAPKTQSLEELRRSKAFKFISLDRLASGSPIVDVITADEVQRIAVLDCDVLLADDELAEFRCAAHVDSEEDGFYDWLRKSIVASRECARDLRARAREVAQLSKQGHTAAQIAKTLYVSEEDQRQMKTGEGRSGLDGIGIYPLDAFFSPNDFYPPPDVLNGALRKAHVIMGLDETTLRTFVVFGQDALEDIRGREGAGDAQVIYVEIDENSDELKKLCALVESVKGRHEYQSDHAA